MKPWKFVVWCVCCGGEKKSVVAFVVAGKVISHHKLESLCDSHVGSLESTYLWESESLQILYLGHHVDLSAITGPQKGRLCYNLKAGFFLRVSFSHNFTKLCGSRRRRCGRGNVPGLVWQNIDKPNATTVLWKPEMEQKVTSLSNQGATVSKHSLTFDPEPTCQFKKNTMELLKYSRSVTSAPLCPINPKMNSHTSLINSLVKRLLYVVVASIVVAVNHMVSVSLLTAPFELQVTQLINHLLLPFNRLIQCQIPHNRRTLEASGYV